MTTEIEQQNLTEARACVVAWGVDRVAKRKAFTVALIAFQHQFGGPITREQLMRQHCADELAIRKGLKDGTIPPAAHPRLANSVIDRQSARYGDANTFTQKQLQTGHRRGSLPSSMRGRTIPPSQR